MGGEEPVARTKKEGSDRLHGVAIGRWWMCTDRVRDYSGLWPDGSGHGSRFTAETARSVPSPSASSPALAFGDLDRLTSVSRTGVGENTGRFGYDAVGNRTSTQVGSGEVVSPRFDNRKQLQQQAPGRRVVKSTPEKVTTSTYDAADILRENVTARGNTTTSYYVRGPSIDEPPAGASDRSLKGLLGLLAPTLA